MDTTGSKVNLISHNIVMLSVLLTYLLFNSSPVELTLNKIIITRLHSVALRPCHIITM